MNFSYFRFFQTSNRIFSMYQPRILIILILLFHGFSLVSQTPSEKEALKKYFADMVPLRKSNYYPYLHDYELKATDRDSFLLLTYFQKRMDVSDFMISKHEVTNLEYFRFVNWVRDSIAKSGADRARPGDLIYSYINSMGKNVRIAIYPDTTVWSRDINFAYGLDIHYFSHKTYQNYPVVGVSYYQALAYIHWLNERLKVFLIKNHYNSNLCSYRLPSEVEWQYAALAPSDKLIDRSPFPWDGLIFDNKIGFKANMGQVFDANNLGLKGFCDDGYCHTAPVRSYKPNRFGLYDMAGNVAEWVADTFSVNDFMQITKELIMALVPEKITSGAGNEKKDSALRRIVVDELLAFSPDWGEISGIIHEPFILQGLRVAYQKAERDYRIVRKGESLGILKGGSWFDVPVYLMSGIRQVYPQAKSNARSGFRVALSFDDEMWKYLQRDN